MLELSRNTTGRTGFRAPLVIGLALLFSLMAFRGHAQALPAGALDQLDTAIGQRVEATAILGTQDVASRSGLGWT